MLAHSNEQIINHPIAAGSASEDNDGNNILVGNNNTVISEPEVVAVQPQDQTEIQVSDDQSTSVLL